ncbi:Deleted in malignant brain tumors 1 protein [Anabarilius grahami]|uniref:Deleted in malignant brain tumors 1 protein n=1 Tax=Anabarilius grahami TaxID=495550 RepID=A0A3N0XE23_ANAGA|nr:Deleted in malignant brain tumors 1 protein [Anabarilius grahami]
MKRRRGRLEELLYPSRSRHTLRQPGSSIKQMHESSPASVSKIQVKKLKVAPVRTQSQTAQTQQAQGEMKARVKEIKKSTDPGLWPERITDREREVIVRKLVTASETDLKTIMPKDSERKTFPEYLQFNKRLLCAGNVRLVGGNGPCAGRVEVLHDGQWGTVCDDGWDMNDAAVVCREMNCGRALRAVGDAHFGQGSGPIWMDEVKCTGSEPTLEKCELKRWGENNCGHHEDAGVICIGYTDLRLVNGSDSCSGRVELRFLNKWGTVCDACWDMRAASVLCRQLNCGIAVSVVGSDWFEEGSGEIWADVFDCDGNETKLSECSISSWSRAECSHRRDVGVICSSSSLAVHDGLVRLSGERQCEGEVEVSIHQVWRRVLLDSWSLTESSVVCRQLGCGSVLNFSGSSSSSPEHSHECVTGFQCSGSEAHLGNCSSPQTLNCSSTQQLSITCLGWGKHDCQHKDDVGVVCSVTRCFNDSEEHWEHNNSSLNYTADVMTKYFSENDDQ